jgi:UDP-N-acetylmuramate dehydrogenase
MINNLPEVRGRYTENAALGAKGWFRCGGTADVLFKPADQYDLQDFLKNCPADIPVYIFGALSNSIIRDGGLRGVVVRLNRDFADIKVDGDVVTTGALALDGNVANIAAENGIGGVEFLSGIPGSIGGALRMNAGCYGREMKDVLVSCQALDRMGNLHTLTPDQMGMTYRHVEVPEDYIFLNATLQGVKESSEVVKARMTAIKTSRENAQPIREKTGGSTFANPSAAELSQAGLSEDMKVWQLIDSVGGRGLQIGGAVMSEKHCNFMINAGDAIAADLEALGHEIRSRVLKEHGITLRWEIRRIGEA